ncbi:hypothetical protein JTB14_029807 [Gonioctena quinquepunctata]|nr:hypothetical protein JTB14_029807 [Gonioctena quinquepunctata]
MATEEEISTLKRKRGGLKAKLTLFKTFVEQTTNKSILNDVDLIELDQRINRIDPLLEDFDRVQEALEFATNNHEEQLAERASFESSFFAVTSIAKGLLSKARASITSGENNVASDNVSVRSVGNIQIGSTLRTIFNFYSVAIQTEQIVFGEDIEKMFHQVHITKRDRCAQLFLLRGMEENRNPDVNFMEAVVFGAISSPSAAQFVKNKNAAPFDIITQQ